jgi:5-methylcytosine-specific restriction protein A
MTTTCSDAKLRQEILRCLLNSIGFVERVAPQAWAVTLFDNGFRLNVGQVEALTCGVFADEEHLGSWRPFEVRLLTQGELPAEVLSAQQRESSCLQIWPTPYKSVPLPQHVVSMSFDQASELSQWLEMLGSAHERYLSAALRTSTGRPRSSTTFRRTHSQGLIDYAMTFCSEGAAVTDMTAVNELDLAETGFFEGRPIAVRTTRYEREEGARRACLLHHGYKCAACGFNFGAVYGSVADLYIQVHHLNPLASAGGELAINPIIDMRPLCANCHAVAHFKNPPYTVEEIRSFINKEYKS